MIEGGFYELWEFDDCQVFFHGIREGTSPMLTATKRATVKALSDSDDKPPQVHIRMAMEGYPKFMQPDTGVTPTGQQLISAINAGPWLAVMMYRDWVEEQKNPAADSLLFGLTWLIDYRKFPRVCGTNPDRFCWEGEDTHTVEASTTSGRQTVSHTYYTQTLPDVVMTGLMSVFEDGGNYVFSTPKQFKNIYEAFHAAAVAVYKHRGKLDSSNSGSSVGEPEGYDGDVDWDAPEPPWNQPDAFGG